MSPNPGRGPQNFQPVQGSAASSSVFSGHAGEGVFRTFPKTKKVRHYLRTPGRHCLRTRAHGRRQLMTCHMVLEEAEDNTTTPQHGGTPQHHFDGRTCGVPQHHNTTTQQHRQHTTTAPQHTTTHHNTPQHTTIWHTTTQHFQHHTTTPCNTTPQHTWFLLWSQQSHVNTTTGTTQHSSTDTTTFQLGTSLVMHSAPQHHNTVEFHRSRFLVWC